jgi:hypothetical protein
MKKLIFVLLLMFGLSSVGYSATNINNARKTISAVSVPEVLVSTYAPFRTATICAETDNTGVISLGGSSVVGNLSNRTGIPLSASDCKTYHCNERYDCGNLNTIYADTTVSGDGVTIEYITAT